MWKRFGCVWQDNSLPLFFGPTWTVILFLPVVTSSLLSNQTRCTSRSCWLCPRWRRGENAWLCWVDGVAKCCLTCVYTARSGSLFFLAPFCGGRLMFSRGSFLWKAGTPEPRQHNQCSSWLRGRGGVCGFFYLISVSTRASVWCKRVGAPPSPHLSFSLT